MVVTHTAVGVEGGFGVLDKFSNYFKWHRSVAFIAEDKYHLGDSKVAQGVYGGCIDAVPIIVVLRVKLGTLYVNQ